MQVAPIPVDEAQRLGVLRSLDILDTPSELCFNVAVGLAAKALKAPVAAVSLVDENRQWFKAMKGLNVRETPREVAFCAHTILGDEPLVVPNTTVDDRFKNNVLVTHAPHIRSYVGMPLRVKDAKVGTLCVIDHEPREFGRAQLCMLRKLADMVEMFLVAQGPR
ncbi:GAF domain-containing protein [Limnobacter sp.]|uniref:GAF domain-containing protein n=1 Tax=Limnobacter sp. TaxID=2003368 RepID=UPI00351306A2